MKNKIPIKEFGIKRDNEERRDGGCAFVYDPMAKKYAVGRQHADGLYRLFSGGIDEGESIEACILREVEEESGLYDFSKVIFVAEAMTHYHNSLKNVNRVAHATCLFIVLNTCSLKPVALEAHEKFDLVWVTLEELAANWHSHNTNHDMDHWLYFLSKLEELK